MGRSRIAKATVALEQLDRQSVSFERLAALEQKTVQLADAGVSYEAIVATRDEMNALADKGIQYDFNDALLHLYDETFGSSTPKEER